MTSCRTYSPYGAWELKRTYQRNLLLANMCVVALVILAVGIPSILAYLKPVAPFVVDDGPFVPDGPTGPPPPLTTDGFRVVRDNGGPALSELVAIIPTPVADSLFADFDSPVIASRTELAGLNYAEPCLDCDTGAYAGGGGPGVGATDFIEPDIDEFVPVDIEPKMIHEVKPGYPRQAQMTGMEGDVWVAVLVGIDGSPRAVRIRRPSGIAALDLAAEEAAWKNRFSPAIRGGEPILIWVIYKVSFRMNE